MNHLELYQVQHNFPYVILLWILFYSDMLTYDVEILLNVLRLDL